MYGEGIGQVSMRQGAEEACEEAAEAAHAREGAMGGDYHHHHHHKHSHKYRGDKVSQGIDLQSVGGGFGGFGGGGFGGGGGLVAGLVLGSLLRRDGRDDCGPGGNGVDTLTSVAILQKLGDVQAAVPASTAAIENSTLNQTIGLNNSLSSLALGLCQGFSNLKDSVQASAALNLAATQNVNQTVLSTTCEIKGVVHTEGELTRALINNLNTENLNRIITTQAAALIELRGDAHRASDNHSINISMAQNQAQAQLQAQAQNNVLEKLVHLIADTNQVARATAANANFIIGNAGATTTGAQTATASPVNVKA